MISTSIVLRGMSNAIATLPLPRPISRLAKMHTCCPTHQQFAPFPQPSSRLFRLAATTLGSTSSRSNSHRNAHGAPLPPCGPNRRALVPASLAPRAAANKFDPQTPAASESQHSLRQRAALLALGAAALAGALISPSLAYAGEYRSNVGPFSPPIATIAAPAPAPLKAEPDPSALHESKAPLPSASELTADELAVVRLFQQNTPGVVNISNIAAARTPFSMDIMKIPQGQGSGFIWDDKGHIVTNAHVVRGAFEVRVSLIDQSVYKAKLVGKDDSKDIAVLQLDAPQEVIRQLRPIQLGSSTGLFVGQRVLAIGNPFGLDHTLTSGIISGLNRELASNSSIGLRNVIQTDAAINPGNSGGPLLDSKGRLIGINTAIASPSGAFNGVGFAIPVDSVKGLVEQILQYGRVIRPVLGITIAPPQALRQLQLEGVLVLDVPAGSPAYKAGMTGISKDGFGRVVIGDVIVGIKGKPVRSERDLFDVLDSCRVGEKVQVEVLRKGEEKRTLNVALGERAPEPSD